MGCDNVEQLEENISIATDFEPLSPAEMARIEGLTDSYAAEAAFFKKGGAGFGRSEVCDESTAQNRGRSNGPMGGLG